MISLLISKLLITSAKCLSLCDIFQVPKIRVWMGALWVEGIACAKALRPSGAWCIWGIEGHQMEKIGKRVSWKRLKRSKEHQLHRERLEGHVKDFARI